jgi:hypothetical protein
MPNDRPFRRTGLAVLAIVWCTAGAAQSGDYDWTSAEAIAPGIRYAKLEVVEPRPLMVHCLRIDTTAAPLRFHTTGRADGWTDGSAETLRRTTREFIEDSRAAGMDMVVAINADAFSPWPVPWDQESLTDLLGLAVSDGVVVSSPSGTPSFLVYRDGRMEIAPLVTRLDNVQTAVSGFALVLRSGVPVSGSADLHPRTGIGLSEDRRVAYFLVIDGRRVESVGVTTEEVGRWLLHFGAHDGINMDGGGSTTMARYVASAAGVVLLNTPVGNGARSCDHCAPTERNNGNNIGVYLAPAAD